jgi:hypothetical protein
MTVSVAAYFDPSSGLWESDQAQEAIAERDGRFKIEVSREPSSQQDGDDGVFRFDTFEASAEGVLFSVTRVSIDDVRFVTGGIYVSTPLGKLEIALGDIDGSWLETDLGRVFLNLFEPLMISIVENADSEEPADQEPDVGQEE